MTKQQSKLVIYNKAAGTVYVLDVRTGEPVLPAAGSKENFQPNPLHSNEIPGPYERNSRYYKEMLLK